MAAIFHPFLFFNDKDGLPLDNGTVYFGTPNLNPVTNPVPVFFDNLYTLPAPQPIKTLNGYLANNGQPTAVYASVQVSIAVFNKKGELVYYVGSTVIPIGLQGIQGPAGTQGIQGNPTLWRTGSGVPSNALGINGDLYLNVVNGDVYQKAGGVYTLQANIKGLPGTNGANGTNGINGTNAPVFKQIDVGTPSPSNITVVTAPVIFTTVNINDASQYNTGVFTSGRVCRVLAIVSGGVYGAAASTAWAETVEIQKNAVTFDSVYVQGAGAAVQANDIQLTSMSRIINMNIGDTLRVARPSSSAAAINWSGVKFSVTELT